jgi:hypothetical protein
MWFLGRGQGAAVYRYFGQPGVNFKTGPGHRAAVNRYAALADEAFGPAAGAQAGPADYFL